MINFSVKPQATRVPESIEQAFTAANTKVTKQLLDEHLSKRF